MPKHGPSKRRILWLSSLGAVITFCVAAFPVIRLKVERKEAHRIEQIYASGLMPCDFYPGGVDALTREHLPGSPSLAITSFPTFSPPVSVFLVGDALYLFEIERVRDPDGSGRLELRGMHQAHMSSRVAAELAELLSDDVGKASAKFSYELDGTYVYFTMPGRRCAMTWSPSRDTRAGAWVAVFNLLIERAGSEGHIDTAADDQEILEAIRNLKVKRGVIASLFASLPASRTVSTDE